MRRTIVMAVGLVLFTVPAAAQRRTDSNVVYGMFSGTALLMDVHRPNRANGFGVVFIPGNGFQAPLTYDAVPLKDFLITDKEWLPPLLDAGYTVFAINHRAAPRFHYPAALEDVQRAIRFVRHRAAEYGIDPNRLGGVGISSGAHLIGLAGLLGSAGVTEDPDPVNRASSSLASLILVAAPTDLTQASTFGARATGLLVSFLELPPSNAPTARRLYAEASPRSHVSSTAPPVLLIHGDADELVPYQQSVAMETALIGARVPVQLVRILGGTHAARFGAGETPDPKWPDYLDEMIHWLDRHVAMRSMPGAIK